MKEQRLKNIEKYLKEKEVCHLDELSERFNVSKITIRRDVESLCSLGVSEKVYGGVKYIGSSESSETVPFLNRANESVEAKNKIGEIAASLVNEGDTIFIDSGTTTIKLLDYIGDKKINVISASVPVINRCAKMENVSLISTGGEFLKHTNSFVGELPLNAMEIYNFNKAFMAATAVHHYYGFTNSSAYETKIKKKAVMKSKESFVMFSSDKCNKFSLSTFATFQDIKGIITDKEPTKEILNVLKKINKDIYI
ncbi:MAG: DeoR/GlpR family DNA-binding transcription regulator [Lachnospirales bacterium]